MKTKLTPLAFILFGFSALCQDYYPLTATVPKRFENATNPSDNNFYFYALDTNVSGDTMIYTQYVQKVNTQTNFIHPSCDNWGGAQDADTTWLGRYAKYNITSNELILKTKNEAQLRFDFGIQLGDSSLFYQTATEEYYIKYISKNQETILSELDSVKSFEINKYDNLGNPLSSSLNGFQVKLGKDLGLVQFMECNQFPMVEKGLQLMGQLNPTIGYYQMTYDELYPWNVGDTLEYYMFYPVPPSGYRIMHITDRVETADSVWIYFNESNSSGLTLLYEYSSPITFKKGENVTALPHNGFYDQRVYVSDSADFCGLRGRFQTYSTPNYFCDSCNCMPFYDAVGDLFITMTFQSGLGLTHYKSEYFSSGLGVATQDLIYSNIGGQICGAYVPLSTDELSLNFSIAPNPVNDVLEINSDIEINQIEILSSGGSRLSTQIIHGAQNTIDVSQLDRGIYFIRASGANGKIGVTKFVKGQ